MKITLELTMVTYLQSSPEQFLQLTLTYYSADEVFTKNKASQGRHFGVYKPAVENGG